MAEKSVQETMDEVKTLAVGIQSEFKSKTESYDAHVAETDGTIKNMETKFGELSEQIQTTVAEKESFEKSTNDLKEEVKQLTLLVARGGNEAEDKAQEFMTDEVKSAFHQAISTERSLPSRHSEVVSQIVAEQVKKTWGHMPSANQDVLVKSILSEGSAVAGGMWCPTPVDSRIRKRIFETSSIRGLANVMNINEKGMEFALDDEDFITAVAGEVDARNETGTPEFGKVNINVHEQYARPKATNAVIEDSTLNLSNYIADKASNKFAREQNKAFLLGDGIKEAKGILTYADADAEVYERNKIGTQVTSDALSIGGDDLIDLQSHLLEEYQNNAVWMMHRLSWAKVVKLKDNDGQYLLDPLMLFNGATPRLLGADVRMAGDMPKPVSGSFVAGDNAVLYGDFREGYTILDRLGINVILDQITEFGFTKWNFRTRYGAGITNFQAFKRLQIKAGA